MTQTNLLFSSKHSRVLVRACVHRSALITLITVFTVILGWCEVAIGRNFLRSRSVVKILPHYTGKTQHILNLAFPRTCVCFFPSALINHGGTCRWYFAGLTDDGGREHLGRAARQHCRQNHTGSGHKRGQFHLLQRVHQGGCQSALIPANNPVTTTPGFVPFTSTEAKFKSFKWVR